MNISPFKLKKTDIFFEPTLSLLFYDKNECYDSNKIKVKKKSIDPDELFIIQDAITIGGGGNVFYTKITLTKNITEKETLSIRPPPNVVFNLYSKKV